MTYFIDRLGVIRWWLFAVLAAFAPFHAFLITWLRSEISGPFVLFFAAWREIIVALIICIAVAENFLRIKRGEKIPKLDLLEKFIFAFVVLSLIFGYFQKGASRDFFQWVWGFRYDVFPLLLLAATRKVRWGNIDRLIKIALLSGFIVLILGFLHSFILPKDFLAHFGYSLFPGPYRPDIPISACQYLEHTSAVCRAISTFGGPTRYGIYLLFLLGLAAFRFPKIIPFIVLGIFTTFSRSVIIGFFALGIFYLFKRINARKLILGIFSAFIILSIIFSVVLFRSQGFETFVVRKSSTSEHLAYMKHGFETIVSRPLGLGLGTAGPASLRFEKFLTENWYLQIGVEMGILGLLLYLGIIIILLKKLLGAERRSLAFGLGLALLGISVAGLFSHSFEETTAALLLFGFIGMAFSRIQLHHSKP